LGSDVVPKQLGLLLLEVLGNFKSAWEADKGKGKKLKAEAEEAFAVMGADPKRRCTAA
jgi:hypothetical protein